MAITDVKEGRYRDTFQFREIIKTIFCRRATFFPRFSIPHLFSNADETDVSFYDVARWLRRNLLTRLSVSYLRETKNNGEEGEKCPPRKTIFVGHMVKYSRPTIAERRGDPISAEILLPNRWRRRDGYSKASHIGIQNFTVR